MMEKKKSLENAEKSNRCAGEEQKHPAGGRAAEKVTKPKGTGEGVRCKKCLLGEGGVGSQRVAVSRSRCRHGKPLMKCWENS